MLGAEIIAKTLKSLGVKKVFLYPGGTIAPLLDALIKEGIEYICTRSEQGAGFAAIGAAKVTGDTQIVMVTSGPGVTNVVTPVADAYYDSVPLLIFTGQVGTKDINKEKKIRQTGFQETDSVGIFKPITKKTYILTSNENIEKTITEFFTLTKDGRHGPVLIDLPMDVQKNDIKTSVVPNIQHCYADKKSDQYSKNMSGTFRVLYECISSSRRPLILAGNGIYSSNAVNEFRLFSEKFNIPVVMSLPGIGILPSDHPLAFSFIGHTGEYFSNLAVFESDLLIVLGARLDVRQIGTEIADFQKNKYIFRVDIDENELEHGRINADMNVNTDLKVFLTKFLSHNFNEHVVTYENKEWIEKIYSWKTKFHSSQFYKNFSLSSYDIISAVDKITKNKEVIVTSGVGIHQQMVARFFSFNHPSRRWLTSAGHGTMGFDLPVAFGAVLTEIGKKDTIGIVFVGDGSFQMNTQELATIEEYNLPIKIFVLDNKRLGIVSQFQLLNWGNDPSTGSKKNPSFSGIGRAYGIDGFDIYTREDIPLVLDKVFRNMSPVIVHCHIDSSEDILPMLLAGQKMNEMYPFKNENI